MYQIKPVQEKADQARMCELCKIKYDADLLAYAATYDDGRLIGICQFTMRDDMGYVYELAAAPGVDDFEPMYIMGKAALNFIDLCGIKKARYLGSDSPLIRAVGFEMNEREGGLFVNLNGFFEHKCGGK